MTRLWGLCLIMAFLLGGASPLLAQDIYIQNEPQIIVPIGIRAWEGTPQELRWIDRVSVPSSYKGRCESEKLSYTTVHVSVTKFGCFHDLMNWHFNFGTERSTEKAMRYIAERVTREYDLSPDAANRYIELLPEGLAEARAYLAAENLTYKTFLEKDRVIETSQYPALAELKGLNETLSKTSDIASFYIIAADWYRSASLLREAARWYGYLPVVRAPAAEENLSDHERLLQRVASLRQDEFLGVSLAVARAATERTEASILAAHEWSARVFKPAFQARDLRDFDNGRQAEQYRYLRFRIQLLADIEGLDIKRHEGVYLGDYDFRDMETLFRPEERGMASMHYLVFPERRRFAEILIAQGEHAVEVATDCSHEQYDYNENLDILFNSGRVISQAHRPAPYRRIAELYVELFSTLQKCEDKEAFWYLDRAPYHNQARHYQHFIDNYAEIALGR